MARQRPRKSVPVVAAAITPSEAASLRWLTPNVTRAMLAALLLVFAIRAYSSLRQESATWDETMYFGLGKYLLKTQHWDVPGAILHPPLSYYLNSVPLLFADTDPEPWKYNANGTTDPRYIRKSDNERGQAFLSSPANAGNRLLTASRMMMVATAVLLGVFVFRWSRALWGPASALVATGLFTFDPNILAHARLITPDISVTTFSFIAMYYFWRLLSSGHTRDGAWAGVSLGLALLSKFTGALLMPIVAAVAVLGLWQKRRINTKGFALALVVSGIVLCAGYAFNTDPYFAGIEFQQSHAAGGQGSFLAGAQSASGWWYYLPFAFLIKTPVAFSVLIVIAAAWLIRHARTTEWLNEACLLLPVAGVAGFFIVNHMSIGLRYLLPIYPFLFVFASRVAVWLVSGTAVLRGLVLALLAWQVGASLWIQPHYLAYFNELVGGPSQGYKYLVDSNLDWGQDLPGLKRFMDEHGIERIHFSYFGSDSPSRYGIAYDPLPSYELKGDDGTSHPFPHGSWVAVSATNLQGAYFTDKNYYEVFRNREPDAVVGYSIFLYYLK
jgi:4-amino-4-deoxy-L-arabinose transferase-like glycosyltransferase